MSPTAAAGRREAVAAAVVALVLSAVVSFAPPPGADVLNAALHDFGHVVVFAATGFALARAAGPRQGAPLGLGRIRLVIVFHDGPLPGRRVLVRRIGLLP